MENYERTGVQLRSKSKANVNDSRMLRWSDSLSVQRSFTSRNLACKQVGIVK